MTEATKTLDEIGFYTLSERRVKQASAHSPLWRCELILTDRCNFHCPYCRGLGPSLKGDMDSEKAKSLIDYWLSEGLRNIRFSGGEPTLYHHLPSLVEQCVEGNVEHIAVSTNGSASYAYYEDLIFSGVNDFSISLDAGCCSIGETMNGGFGKSWEKSIENIRALSKMTYVTVGMVFNELNISNCVETVLLADSLGVADIRIIPAAQYNKALNMLSCLSDDILQRHPVLKYRIENIKKGYHVRGTSRISCPLVLDDMAVAGRWHYPCIIYMRERGNPIGEISSNMRRERQAWYEKHNPSRDIICSQNCLDVCIAYNNRWDELHRRSRK